MIIYQFKMLGDGTIKVSSAEYQQIIGKNCNICYKKIKTLEKGVRQPRFPKILRYLGENLYFNDCEYYALSMDELATYKATKIHTFENSIKMCETKIEKFKEMINNLRS